MAPDRLIHTGIDRLMEYLEEREEVEVTEAAQALGADRETIITWANSLADAGLLEITFSARRGRVLHPTSDEEVTDEAMEQAREETAKRMEELVAVSEDETDIERFEEELERLQELLEESAGDARALHDRLDAADREQLEDVLDDLDLAEDGIETVETHLSEAVAGLRMLEQMAEEQGGGEDTDGDGLLARLRGAIPFVGGGGDPDDGDGDPTFKCEECGEGFEESWQKAQHVRREHSDDG